MAEAVAELSYIMAHVPVAGATTNHATPLEFAVTLISPWILPAVVGQGNKDGYLTPGLSNGYRIFSAHAISGSSRLYKLLG